MLFLPFSRPEGDRTEPSRQRVYAVLQEHNPTSTLPPTAACAHSLIQRPSDPQADWPEVPQRRVSISCISVRAFCLKSYSCFPPPCRRKAFPQIPSFSLKRASDERADRGTVTAPNRLAFPTRFRAASMPRGSVSAEHSGDGGAFETVSACRLTCDAGVCLFLAGWNIIAPWADRDKWWCGEYTPLSVEGVGICS